MPAASDWRSLAEDCWRLLGVGLLAVGAFLLAMRLRLVILPLFAAAMIAVVATPLADWLTRRRVPPALAAMAAVLALLLGTLAVLAAAVAVAVNDADRIGERFTDGTDQVAEWLSDGPLGIPEEDVQEARDDLGPQARERFDRWVESGGLLDSTVTALEALAGALLAVVASFFLVKDRDRLARRTLDRWAEPTRSRVKAVGTATLGALRGYLRGVVILGTVEGVIIGGTVSVMASPTYGVPMALLTFLAAFFPVVGAVLAGLLAVVVTLAAAGPLAALVVGAVALVVQQLDNDLLAPVIYGRVTQIHPVGILVALATGSVLAGIAGAFVAVPLTAMVMGGLRAHRDFGPPRDGAAAGDVDVGDVSKAADAGEAGEAIPRDGR